MSRTRLHRALDQLSTVRVPPCRPVAAHSRIPSGKLYDESANIRSRRADYNCMDTGDELLFAIRQQIDALEHHRSLSPLDHEQQQLYDWLVSRERQLLDGSGG